MQKVVKYILGFKVRYTQKWQYDRYHIYKNALQRAGRILPRPFLHLHLFFFKYKLYSGDDTLNLGWNTFQPD
jgi:hypothetical protein